MDSIANFRDQILSLPRFELPVVTAFADLGRGGSSGEPTAWRVIEPALREQAQAADIASAAATTSFRDDIAALEAAIDAAVADGALGLAYVGCAGEGVQQVLRLPVPLRNSAAIGPLPPVFELDRARYLYGQGVVLALVDIHTVELRRVAFGETVGSGGLDVDAHALTKSSRGRTNIEGRNVTPGGGFAGGHSRNDIERVVRAHRLQFAKAAGEEVAGFIESDDLLIVAGPVAARAQLLQALPERIAERVLETTHEPDRRDDPDLIDFAVAEALESRLTASDRRVEELFAGDYRDQGVRGPQSVRGAIERGQLGELIIHDDTVANLGTADDARPRPGVLAAGELETLIRGAHGLSAEVTISRSAPLLEQGDGVAGILRW